MLLSSHRLLVQRPRERAGGGQGVHRDARGRHAPSQSVFSSSPRTSAPSTYRRRPQGRPRRGRTGSAIAIAAAALLLGGAVGKSAQLPAPDVAPRRDGRPDARLRPHPCSHDGNRRRLSDRQDARHLRACPARPYSRRRHRRRHASDRGRERPGPARHQAHPRLLDDEPGRLYVLRPRRRRVVRRHSSTS